METLTPEAQYKKEYDEAAAKLESGDVATATLPAETVEMPIEPAVEKEEATPDPLEELRLKLEKTEKALKDTQAWGTKNSQRLAAIERERQEQLREATRPTILDANPELADAIRYVAHDPTPIQQAQAVQDQFFSTVEKVHPGIFNKDADPELIDALVTRREALGEAWLDPLVAIREISEEKLRHTERQVGKRFLVESKKLAAKTTMSVPGAGGGAARALTPDLDEVNRINNLSDADFAREVKKVKGLL